MPEAQLDRFYGSLRNYVRMVTNGYSNMLMLDAKGGLGKTHNVRETLSEELEGDGSWHHQKGFTTPLELYKTLWRARREGTVLFLDDMSGVTGNTKAIDMLKSATDTQGDENVVEYRTSRDIDNPIFDDRTLPNAFTFRGSVIMSFNETPENRHFNALKDRGTFHKLSFTHEERLDLISEIAKLDDFSDLSVADQMDTADWIARIANSSYNVTIRTFEEVCKMRAFGQDMGEDWEKMALDVFDIDREKRLIIEMRESGDMSTDEQIEQFKQETGKSQSTYYRYLDEIRESREL